MKITVESSWIFALDEEQLPEGRITAVYPKGVALLLIKTVGEIFAIANKCAHMACSLVGGTLEGHTLQCPCHGWQFDIRTGEFVVAKEIKIPVYEWKLQDGKIFVKLEERKE